MLQAWGGGLYLLNKICFAFAAGRPQEKSRRLRICGWLVYLLGVPAWVILLVGRQNWIAASIEAGGVPSMILGLLGAWQSGGDVHPRFVQIARFSTWGALLLGVGYSLYDYGGLTSISQLLEVGVMLGFLLGSYLLAREHLAGWFFFVLMNLSMASLMFLQQKPLLAGQQLLSLCFVLYGLRQALQESSSGRRNR